MSSFPSRFPRYESEPSLRIGCYGCPKGETVSGEGIVEIADIAESEGVPFRLDGSRCKITRNCFRTSNCIFSDQIEGLIELTQE